MTYSPEYYQKYKASIIKAVTKWKAANKEKSLAYNRKSRAKRRAARIAAKEAL